MPVNYEEKIKSDYPYANDIARAVGVAYPRSNESAGAKWLLRIRDAIANDADIIMASDDPYDEVPYDGLECYTFAQWEIFLDLELWSYDADLTYCERADFRAGNYGTESVPAIRVSDIPGLASRLLDEIAVNIGNLLIQELISARDESDESDESDETS